MARNWQKDRLNKLFANLKGADTVFIMNMDVNDPNFRYLTGFIGGLFEGDALIAKKNRLYFLTSPLEYQTALGQKPNGMTIINNKADFRVSRRWISRLIRGKRVGINGQFLPVGTYDRVKKRYKPKKMVDVSEAFMKARLTKDADEIQKIRKAIKITKTALKEIQKYFKAGVTETELAARFDFIQMSLGASGPSFDTIVSFGKNAALPHHSPDKTRLRKGDFVLIDCGSKFQNYCSDITRTFIFGGKGDKQQKEMLQIVSKAQKDAIKAIKPGKNGKDIHLLAANVINTAAGGKYKGRFIHSLGHSLGIEVHDGPGFGMQDNMLKPGMVITVEPGIYIPGFGGVRIEDDILITEDGCEVL